MSKLAVIGGTGLTTFDGLDIIQQHIVDTPYGETSGPVTQGIYQGKTIIFLARHGTSHTIPPHKINYRANIWSLKELGVQKIIACAAVGGIASNLQPGDLVIPHQLIDYTDSRKHTFFEDNLDQVTHIDFTQPYCETLRQNCLTAAHEAKLKIHASGVYGATQGPRLETAAEIDRLERDGCDIVGMTGMPEAALARELDLCYVTCAIIANHAAGRNTVPITMADIQATLAVGVQRFQSLLAQMMAA
jgi:5'-methylthioinosine phosphorylase